MPLDGPDPTMRDEPLTEGVLRVLREALPAGWSADPEPGTGGAPRLAVRAPDGSRGALRLRIRSTLAPRDVRALGEEPGSPPIVVVAPYVGPVARSALEELGFGYADLTGNIRITLDRPGLFVAARGADRDPRPERRASRTLAGDKAGRVVRALVEAAVPPGVRELAERTETAAGYVSRVVGLLDREALLERDGRGRILRVAWRRLLERRAEEAPLERRGAVTSCLAARGLEAFLLRAQSAGERVAATGTLAVSDLAPIAPTRLAIVYARDAASMLSPLELRVAERGANVWLVEPRDDWVFRGTRRVDGLPVVGVVQACADLLTSPGRGPAEGAALLDWMQANEAAWRA